MSVQCQYHVPFMVINHHWWTWHVSAQLVSVLCTLRDDKSPLTQPESCWHEATASSSEVYLWALGHLCIHWYLMKAPDCLGPFPMIQLSGKLLNFQWNATSLLSQSQSAVYCGKSLLAGVCRDPVTMLSFPFDHSNGNPSSVNGGCYALQDIQLPKVPCWCGLSS